MKKHLVAGVGVLVFLGSSVEAQTLGIEHQPVGCVMAEKFPRLEARFAPGASVATARVLFQGQNPEWYSVAMKPEGVLFVGVLPKPKKSLKSFHYYIEVTDKALATNRTADYTTAVVDNSSACQGKVMAGVLASASVILQGPAGLAALPAGFASTGVVAGSAAGSSAGAAGAATAGGGGLSTGAVVGIIGGVAAAAGVAVAKVKGGGTYTGPFNGTLSVNYPFGGVACSNTHAMSGTLEIRLGGGADTYEFSGTKTQTAGSTTCPSSGNFGIQYGGSVTGAPANVAFKFLQSPFSGFGPAAEFSGAVNGGSISGTLIFSYLAGTTVAGSVSIPVTLR